jgi:hypothetical protein
MAGRTTLGELYWQFVAHANPPWATAWPAIGERQRCCKLRHRKSTEVHATRPRRCSFHTFLEMPMTRKFPAALI